MPGVLPLCSCFKEFKISFSVIQVRFFVLLFIKKLFSESLHDLSDEFNFSEYRF